MAEKVITKSQQALQAEASERFLPDESDQIIADLEKQLAQLHKQLSDYEAKTQHQESPQPSPELQIQLQIKNQHIQSLRKQEEAQRHRLQIVPRLVSKLDKPIAQMTADLEQLIDSVQDPEVQQTLRQCLSIVDGVQQLDMHGSNLDQSLDTQRDVVDLLPFFKELARKFNQENRGRIKLFAVPNLPHSLYIDVELFQKAILILINTVTRSTKHENLNIILKKGDKTIYGMSIKQLQLSMRGEHTDKLSHPTDLEDFLTQSLENSEDWGLDVLYAQKIVEEHGGSLSIQKNPDQEIGFDITLPIQEI